MKLHDDGNYMLDRLVDISHGNRIFNYPLHPYFVLSDLASLACATYAVAFATRFPGTSALSLCIALAASLLGYKMVLEARVHYGGSSSRSFLRDSLSIVVPTFLAAAHFLHQPIAASCAFIGTLIPLYGGFARVGCFLSGCCYGYPSRLGVRYPDFVFIPIVNRWRRFSPGQNPGSRVFPIQIIEAIGQLIIFFVVTHLLWSGALALVKVFPVVFISYSVLRFFIDFWRQVSARPRYGIFSEAQLISIAVGILAGICLLSL